MRPCIGALLAAVALASCTGSNGGDPRSSEPAVGAEARADTLRGTLRLVGSDPFPRWTLQSGQGDVHLTGELLSGVRDVSGLEVWVSGMLRPERQEMDVSRLDVRAVGEVPAVDGILHVRGEDVELVTSDGTRLAVARPPAGLRSHDGAWVWIAGELGAEPVAYGVIRPKR